MPCKKNNYAYVGRNGWPHERKIQIDMKLQRIYWKRKRYLRFEEITGVTAGKSPNSEPFKRKVAKNAVADNCFSIFCSRLKSRKSLDLEASSLSERDAWVLFVRDIVMASTSQQQNGRRLSVSRSSYSESMMSQCSYTSDMSDVNFSQILQVSQVLYICSKKIQ